MGISQFLFFKAAICSYVLNNIQFCLLTCLFGLITVLATMKNYYKENQTYRLPIETHIYLKSFHKPHLNLRIEEQKRHKSVVGMGANGKGVVSVKFGGVSASSLVGQGTAIFLLCSNLLGLFLLLKIGTLF